MRLLSYHEPRWSPTGFDHLGGEGHYGCPADSMVSMSIS